MVVIPELFYRGSNVFNWSRSGFRLETCRNDEFGDFCKRLLEYVDLDSSGMKRQYQKVVGFLEADDFRLAEVKKLAEQDLYRAKLDDANRLLFGEFYGWRHLGKDPCRQRKTQIVALEESCRGAAERLLSRRERFGGRPEKMLECFPTPTGRGFVAGLPVMPNF